MKYDLNQIILADCMDIMRDIPDKYFELAIVDPPYGIGKDGQTKSTGVHGGRKAHAHKGWDNKIPGVEYFTELFRISNNQIIWGGNYFAMYLPSSMGWIFWDKGQRINQSDGELAFSSFQRALRVAEYNRWELIKDGTIHPAQKPVALYRWLLQNYAKPDDKIIDTHSGSGSCAIACHIEKHDFLAIEKDPDYHAASVKRLEEVRAQGVLF